MLTAPAPVSPATRRIFLATLIAQIVIVVTGGAVRLTGSGLGCPTWPQCAEDSYVPLPAQSEGLHKWIEFGNRLLTFVLALVVLIAIIAAIAHYRRHRQGRLFIALAVAQLLGIVAQAVLGGITVLTNLHPVPVAGHFILSVVLITVAATLHMRSRPREAIVVRREVMALGRAITLVSALVIVLGTVVTGSGPHAGDERARRFGFDPRTISWLHADAVILFIGLLLALYLAARLTDAAPVLGSRTAIVIGVSLAQGAIGYIQYFTGLPEIVVGLHLLGATLVWVFTWRLWLTISPSAMTPSARAAAEIA